jgi:hypothetical protein
VAAREDGLTNRLSPSLADACNPLLQAHPPWAQDNTSRGSPFFPLVFHLAPTHLGWDTQRQFTRRSKARQVGACCVLTNSFPSSSRWVVSSNLSSPGRCSVSGVSSSCPSTAATTWYSFLRRATTTMASPHGGRAASESVPSPSPPQEEEAGQPWPSRRQHLVGCRASRRRRRPSGGHVGR